jgi:hypothetical protein
VVGRIRKSKIIPRGLFLPGLASPELLSLHHIKHAKRHMFGILNVDEIKN